MIIIIRPVNPEYFYGGIIMIIPIIAGGIVLLLILWFIGAYNSFIGLKNKVAEAWSGIDVQLKRRYDLIPNLVETVKGYAKHERETFEKVVQARNLAMSAKDVPQRAEAENMISGALKTIFALAENYPELKANQNFLQLQSSLSEIEDNLQNARRYYNAVARDYNIMRESFPSVLVARIFGFPAKDFFGIDEAEKANVKVSF
jgi:LemA protein